VKKINDIMNHQSVKTLLEEVKIGLDTKRENGILKNLALLQKLTLSVKFNNIVKEIEQVRLIKILYIRIFRKTYRILKSDFMNIIEKICENAFQVSSNSKTYNLKEKSSKLGFRVT
jgi:hypothetical protein